MSGELNFQLNGVPVSARPHPVERLSVVLRDHLDQKGTKVGCDAGDCGACTVLIEGKPSCSCMVPAAQVEGCAVTTVEGLQDDGQLSLLQEAFLHHGAAQCGICTPGMLVSSAALLERRCRAPSRARGRGCAWVAFSAAAPVTRKIVDAVMRAGEASTAVGGPARGRANNVGAAGSSRLDGRDPR